jgi:hypothetical protein
MDLRTLAGYACTSEKTLRSWIRSVQDPLPAYQRGNKLYVSRGEYDSWMRRHPAHGQGLDVGAFVDGIINEMRT